MAGNRVRSSVVACAMLAGITAIDVGGVPPVSAQQMATAGASRTSSAARVTVNVTDASLAAVLQVIAGQAGLRVAFMGGIIPSTTRVSLHVRDVAVTDAFEQALRGTGLVASIHASGSVAILRPTGLGIAAGSITGRVTDVKSKQPLRAAKIGVDGTDRVAETADDGTYRITGVSAGSHTLTVKLLGYARVARTIEVSENGITTVDVSLESSATPLEQVVVTGTVIPTELKAVPSAITVITAKQIEERGITRIDQLFRGDVPGLFAQNQGSNASLDEVTVFSRGATALSTASAGTLNFTNPIKTYVDGVELADSKYLSQIDPKSIERIEILTGPQASTIYGSNAINGVMQIFTKRGATSRPQLTLNLLSGFVQNNFSRALTPQHDYGAQLSGLEGHLGYNAGASWDYMGPWTPAKQLTRVNGFGGARLELPTSAGRVTADMTLRHTLTQSLKRGAATQTVAGYQEAGWYNVQSAKGLDSPTTSTLTGQTLGIALSYTPVSWWWHEVGMGTDVSNTEQRYTARGYLSRFDTTLRLYQDHTDRRSMRYVTTAHIPIGTASISLAQLTLTAGADNWQSLISSLHVEPQTLTGSLTNVTDIERQPGHNTGGFIQTQFGLEDRLFVTYGLRAEWNPNYGADAQPNLAPRYGVAYTQDIGPMTLKLRGSYGRSTRPPQPGLKEAMTLADLYGSDNVALYFLPYYDDVSDYRLANSTLGPEHQQGGEGGLELYLGTRSSLVVTRYNQTVDGLIASSVVDSARSLVPCAISFDCLFDSQDANGYGYRRKYQYLNVGSIRNQGWELQGSVNVGPLTTKGTYSWTKSRTIGVNPKYRSFFVNQPQYQPGATFQFLPEHTWALGVTYARARSDVGLTITGVGRATNINDDFYAQNLDSRIRLPQNRLNVSNVGRYVNFNAPYALADLTASHRFAPRVEGVLQVQNLGDRYTNDYYAIYASLGRQIKVGGRVRTQ